MRRYAVRSFRGARRRTRGGLALRGGVLRLDVGLGLVVLRLGVLLAGALFLAFLRVALLFRDLVLLLGLFLRDLALIRGRRVILRAQLGLRYLLLAFGVGLARFFLVALHVLALRLVGLVRGTDAVFLGLARLAINRRLVLLRGSTGGGLRLSGARERERHRGRDAQQLGVHSGSPIVKAFSAGPRRARPGRGPRKRRTESSRFQPPP